MESREFVARRFQLHGGGVSCKITDVRPVKNFDRSSRTCKSGGRESSPQSLKTHISAGHAPLARRLDDLNIVNTYHSFAVDVDQLFVEHVAGEQYFALA